MSNSEVKALRETQAREAAHALRPMEIIGQGVSFAQLANAVSAAVVDAFARGMEVDEAACVVVQVAADYARRAYDDVFLQQLAAVVIARGNMPEPQSRDAGEIVAKWKDRG